MDSLCNNEETSIFPSLRHLHITSPFPPRYLTGKLAHIAPELRHFRLSAPDHNEEFLVELKAVLGQLGIEEGGESVPMSSGSIPSQDSTAAKRLSIFIHCPGKPQDNWMELLDLYDRQMLFLNRLAEEYKVFVRLLPPLRYSLFRTVSIQDAEAAWMQSVAGRSWWALDYAISNDIYVVDPNINAGQD
ncbi:hypothetical protein BT96DRAFT_1042382 [Gymnopus androsaceus JB14]|uniref:Uncharacterized protein n=1 Tax=Gymnopus androsaceus JB14 TaxID=1447944 RepID=A0A6A4IA24_9AGAR|nr:hypothetical protein BT96DRAFT_1042382 [Gymnopus androsaceus JB14]